MPTLDVSDVLVSPEFQDTFVVTSSSRVINANGVAIDSVATINNATGVVIPNPDSLSRQSDGSRLSSSIDIYTQYKLTEGYNIDGTNSVNADIVTWNGRRYVVAANSDFSNFGQGFIKVNATMIDLNSASVSQGSGT